MSKYIITASEMASLCAMIDACDAESMVVYAPEYHKAATISRVVIDVYGNEVFIIDNVVESVFAAASVPKDFLKLPAKKAGAETEPMLRITAIASSTTTIPSLCSPNLKFVIALFL